MKWPAVWHCWRILRQELGPRFFDLLAADALYLQPRFVNKIEASGWDWVITLKGNQPELLAEAERRAATAAPHPPALSQPEELQLWDMPALDWPTGDRDVHVVKAVRHRTHKRQQVEHHDSGEKQIVKITETAPSTNFYASNLDLGSIPPFFIHQLGRSRWQIDAQLFQMLSNEGHLKRPSLHQGYAKALVVLTLIRVLAFTLALVFYYRQVRSHKVTIAFCDLARRTAEQFLRIPVCDSS